MFNPGELEGIPIPLEQQFSQLENRIMQDIVRRIKINSKITRSADWQIYRLTELGKSQQDIKKYIQDTLKLSDDEINKLYSSVIETGYARDKTLYKATGKPFIPFAENKGLQQLIMGISTQTKDELKNITQSLGFAKKVDGKIMFEPIADFYQKTLDGAMLDLTSGAFDYNTVIKRTVAQMTNSGLRTVNYASGWSNRVTVAARRAVMTGFNQVTAKINDDNAKQLDTEYFEVTWHGTARPSHQEWQGKVFTKQELESVCGLGSGDGLCGWNCYHSYFPFVKDISERTYTDEELAELNAKENIKREYAGKEYTAYEASQQQRKMETLMRKQRQDIKLLQAGGADEDEVIFARSRYRSTMAQYVEFSNKMDLPQQRERITVDGFGNVGVGKFKKSVDNKVNSGIIKEKSINYLKREKNEISDTLENLNIEYNQVLPHEVTMTNEEIIQTLAGADKTSGSCASVGLAYIGQKNGYNVLDFRNGESRSWFSSKKNKIDMWDKLGVPYIKESTFKSSLANGKKILSSVQSGKEYYLSVGGHASIVRKTDKGIFQYLELQSAKKSGWTDFNGIDYTLKYRFGCSSSSRYVGTAYLTDIDGLKDNRKFIDVLGYLNTLTEKQVKGIGGTIK